jgi:hypothetical protein
MDSRDRDFLASITLDECAECGHLAERFPARRGGPQRRAATLHDYGMSVAETWECRNPALAYSLATANRHPL